jgi:hypothetical protein
LVLRDPEVTRVIQDRQDHKEREELKDHQGQQDLKVTRVIQDRQDHKEREELKDHQGNHEHSQSLKDLDLKYLFLLGRLRLRQLCVILVK